MLITNPVHIEKFEKLQNKVARLALRLNKWTPSIYIKEILNYKSIKQRLHEIQIKLFVKYARCPPQFMQHNTFNKWKNYVLNNGGKMEFNKNLRNKNIKNVDN